MKLYNKYAPAHNIAFSIIVDSTNLSTQIT